MSKSGATEHSYGPSCYPITRRDAKDEDVLTLRPPGGQTALAVFSLEAGAGMFLWLKAPDEGWQVEESSVGELASLLFGSCTSVERVAPNHFAATDLEGGPRATVHRKDFCANPGRGTRPPGRETVHVPEPYVLDVILTERLQRVTGLRHKRGTIVRVSQDGFTKDGFAILAKVARKKECDMATRFGGKQRGRFATGVPEKLPVRSHHVVARDGDKGLEVLSVPLEGKGQVLPVFSVGWAARGYLFAEAPGGGWYVRACTPGALASLLIGPCAGVEWVALDPRPGRSGGQAANVMPREHFVDYLLCSRAPSLRRRRDPGTIGGAVHGREHGRENDR